jgi:hypothetical protein
MLRLRRGLQNLPLAIVLASLGELAEVIESGRR